MIEDTSLPPIQAKIPEVVAVKVIALTQGSTVATLDMIIKPDTVKGKSQHSRHIGPAVSIVVRSHEIS